MRYKFLYITALGLSLGYLATQTMQNSTPIQSPSPSDSSDEQEDNAAVYVAEFIDSIDTTLKNASNCYKDFNKLLIKIKEEMRSWLKDKENWIPSTQEPWKKVSNFLPYVQKTVVEAGSTVFIFGDLHGDIKALTNALEKLNTDGVLNDQWEIEENNYLIFLGDYTDRGSNGVEVWYTLLNLLDSNQNPTSVVVLRGNHEAFDMNFGSSAIFGQHGYLAELQKKFALPSYFLNNPTLQKSYQSLTDNIYNLLPVAIYLGCNDEYALCSHGGLEIGFNPQPLLTEKNPQRICMALDELKRTTETKKLSENLQEELNQVKIADTQVEPQDQDPEQFTDFVPNGSPQLHFLWNDFNSSNPTKLSGRGSGWALGPLLTKTLLNRDHLHCIFRGHQHGLVYNDPEGKYGLYSFPGSMVHTLMSFSKIPDYDTVCKHYSFIKLSIGTTFSEWKAWHMRDGEEIPIQLASALAPEGTPLPRPTRKRSEPGINTTQATDDNLRAPEEDLGNFQPLHKNQKK